MNEELILKYVLQNAVRYNGKANTGAVIGKVLQEDPELKNDIDRVKGYIELIVKDVNSMTLKNQEEKLKLLAPELLEVKHEKEVRKIPELKKPPCELAETDEDEFAREIAECEIGKNYLRERKTIEAECEARRKKLLEVEEPESFREPGV